MTDREVAAVTARPALPLRRHVDRYLGYRLRGFPAGVHRGLPSRHLTFIVSIGPTIDVVGQVDPQQAPARYRATIGGLAAAPAFIAHGGMQEGVAIELTPLGARSLLGLPASALWNASLELADVIGPAGDELWERLQAAPTWPARFAACDAVLGRLRRDAETSPELRRAWRAVTDVGAPASIEEVAAEVGWTRQHLTRRFRDEFGAAPKLAARVARFEAARRLLAGASGVLPLAEVAARCGYFDQSHLNRDFAAFAGCSPTQWQREEDVPSFQDGGDDDLAPSRP